VNGAQRRMASRPHRAPAQLEAFVLHHYDWSESSLILDLYTREQGRIAVAAKGAKRPHSQLRAALLPFQRIHVTLGRSAAAELTPEVQTLRGAEWAGGQPMLSGAALLSGFYVNELLLKLLARHDPHPALFDAYAVTLAALAVDDEAHAEAGLRAFELTLLRETGVLPELSLVTLTQQPLRDELAYALLPDTGVVAASDDDDASIGAPVLVRLQAALEHGSTVALQHACKAALPALKTALRALLHYHLGSATLRTRQVMLDLQRLYQ
jgi:DNA repair protein RecO (recombination protein O)